MFCLCDRGASLLLVVVMAFLVVRLFSLVEYILSWPEHGKTRKELYKMKQGLVQDLKAPRPPAPPNNR